MSIILYLKKQENLFYSENLNDTLLKSNSVNELSNKLTPFNNKKDSFFHLSDTVNIPTSPLNFLNKTQTINHQKPEDFFFIDWVDSWSIGFFNNKELILARDKMGNKHIYYYDCEDYFIFSEKLGHLLSLPFIPKELNVNVLIQYGPNFKRDGSTFYKNINQLPKAHYISIKDSKLKLHSYWIPKVQSKIYYKNFNNYAEHFNEIYSKAVINSLKGFKKPSIALSSGLDSGSMYALAAPFLENKKQFLETITWKSDVIDENWNLPNRTTDESHFVGQLTKNFNYTNSHIVSSKKGNILSFYKKQLKNCHQPVSTMMPHMMEVYEKGKELGVDVMLNGFGGNFTVSYSGIPNLNLFNFKDTARFFKNKVNDILPVSTINKNTSRDYILNDAIEENIDNYSLLTPHLEQKRKMSKDFRYKHIINLIQSSSIQDISVYTEALGFESRTPVLDSRIIDYCLSIPIEVFYKNGVYKRLIKSAMHHKMPHKILYNKKRGLQGANYISKLRHESKDIFNLLLEFKQSKLISYWLDIDLIKENLTYFINPNTSRKDFREKANLNIILRGIQIGLFLQKFERGDY